MPNDPMIPDAAGRPERVKRYDPTWQGSMAEADNGDYVDYDDYASEVTRLRAEVEALVAALDDADVLVEHHRGYAITAAIRAGITDLRVGLSPELLAAGERYAARRALLAARKEEEG